MTALVSETAIPQQVESAASRKLPYVPALDGLRAVAIIGVLLFHALPGHVNGGFTGVDVFFVLSGYLITSVILSDLRGGTFSLGGFYARRIRRLLPNAALMIVATIALYEVILLPSQAVDVARHGVWALFNLSNVFIWRKAGGYWGESASYFPLLHTWSLAVEEQFYLLFPGVLLLAGRRFRMVFWLMAGSLALCLVGSYTRAGVAFYLLPTRAWEPLLGAVIAMGAPRFKRAGWIGWAGLAAIVAGFCFIDRSLAFPGVVGLIPTLGAAAVLVSVGEKGGPGRVLSHPSLVAVGKVSYSLYLWHWPLIVIGREYAVLTGGSEGEWVLAGAAVGVLLAVVAFHAVEQPCRRFVPMRVLAVGFVLCVCVCVVVGQRRPVADPMGLFERTSFTSPALSVTRWTESEMDWGSLRDLALPPVPKIAADQWTQGGIIHSWEKGHAPRVVVIGSSHALMFASLIDDICRRLGMSVAFLAAPATPVFFPTPIGVKFQTAEAARSFDAARRKWIAEWRPDVIVVADRWDNHFERPGQLARELRGLAEEFAPMTKRMIVINQVPVLRLGERENLREYATWYWRRFGRLPVIREDARGELRRAATSVIRELGREFPHVELLDLGRLYAGADGAVRYVEGRRFLYVDDDHLSDAGAELARAELTRAISR